MPKAKLIYANPYKDPDIYYATHFLTHDPYFFFQIGGKKYLIANELELGRAKREAKVNRVILYEKYPTKGKPLSMHQFVAFTLKKLKVKSIEVPQSTPCYTYNFLRKNRFKVEIKNDPFWPQRTMKTVQEKKYINASQKITFQAIDLVRSALKQSKIRKNFIYYKGKKLTSEWMREMISKFLFERGYIDMDTIVACGDQGVDVHETGSGPLRPHQSIVVDIFPQSTKNLYSGDATRTFCKGRASPELKKMFNTVKAAQKKALTMIKAGANGYNIHNWIKSFFEKNGYKTGLINGQMQGFFHGTGHMLGLETHDVGERPLANVKSKLKRGYVTSVEPGLYYLGIGAVRIEDVVYVTKSGCEVLGNSYPNILEIP